MYMPSGKLWNTMGNENAGIFFEKTADEFQYSFVVKTTAHSIKSILRECKLKLSILVIKIERHHILCSHLTIMDDEKSPLMIVSPHTDQDEITSLFGVFNNNTIPVHFFDELSMNVFNGITEKRDTGISFENKYTYYIGKDSTTTNKALDIAQRHCEHIFLNKRSEPDPSILEIFSIDLVFGNITVNDNYYIGDSGEKSYCIRKDDEGAFHENSVFALLNNIFGQDLYHSPYYVKDNKRKELTDILGIHEHGIVLVEAKTASIFKANKGQSTERKAKNIIKQINKGILQLSGAFNTIYSGEKIFSQEGHEIKILFYNTQFKQAIIIISDFFPGIDWRDIAQKLITQSVKAKACFNILNLMELRTIVGAGNDPDLLHLNLLHRFEKMHDEKNALIIGRFPKN